MLDFMFNLMFNKKKHWFSIEMKYMSNGMLMFTVEDCVGLPMKSDIVLNPRMIKKHLAFWIHQPNTKPLLCNGTLKIKPLCYLGKFKGKPLNYTEVISDYLPIFWDYNLPCQEREL